MNDAQRTRLIEQREGNHECTPDFGCGLPHYLENQTLPRWLAQWPDYSPARQQAEEARLLRDWDEDDDN